MVLFYCIFAMVLVPTANNRFERGLFSLMNSVYFSEISH